MGGDGGAAGGGLGLEVGAVVVLGRFVGGRVGRSGDVVMVAVVVGTWWACGGQAMLWLWFCCCGEGCGVVMVVCWWWAG